MPLDTSIYNQAGRVNLGQGLSSILDQQRQRETQRTQQEQTLAQLAQQKELRGYQLRDLQRKEEAIPQQQAHARSQELNAWLSDAVMSGRPQEEVMAEAIAKGREINVPDEITQRHVQSVFASSQEPKSQSDYAFKQAYPKLVAKQRAAAMFPKQGGSGGSTRGQIIFGNDGMAYLADLDTSTNQTVLKPYINPNTGKQFTAAQWDKGLRSQIKSGEAEGGVIGKETGNAKITLRQNIQSGEDTIRLADELLRHPGLGQAVGKSSMFGLQNIPGTEAKAFMTRLDQLKGKQFMEAYKTLKGGGQITEVEGKKATEALARMDTANTEQEFVTAVKEYMDIIRKGVKQAKLEASGNFVPSENTQDDGWSDL